MSMFFLISLALADASLDDVLVSSSYSGNALAQALKPAPTGSAERSVKDILPEADPYALVHIWTTIYDQDENVLADPGGYGDPEDDSGLKVRRARAGFYGQSDYIKYGASLGFSSPFDQTIHRDVAAINIVDAYVGWSPLSGLWLTAGTQKAPVSREQIMSSNDLVLAERAVQSVWMVPDRDVGFVASYDVGPEKTRARLQLGVFNGNNSLTGDDNDGKLYVARAEMTSGKESTYKTYGTVSGVVIGVGGDAFYNQDIATDTMSYGGDLLVRAAGFAALAEARYSSLSPTNSEISVPEVLSDTNRLGWLAQVGYSIGRTELAVRYSSFDDNTASKNSGDVSAVSAGLTWHGPDDALKIGGGYEARLEGGTAIANDTARLWFMYQY